MKTRKEIRELMNDPIKDVEYWINVIDNRIQTEAKNGNYDMVVDFREIRESDKVLKLIREAGFECVKENSQECLNNNYIIKW